MGENFMGGKSVGAKFVRKLHFWSRFAGLCAAAFLITACATQPQQETDTSGGGGTTTTTTTATTTPSSTTTPAAEPDSDGGAVAVMPGSNEDLVVNVGDRVFFDFDKYNLKAEAQETLQRQAAWLKRFPSKTVVVEGHADERGTREYNLGLGERRANSAKEYLVSLGIDPTRVVTVSYGKERPVALGHNEAAWSQNRRAVTVVAN